MTTTTIQVELVHQECGECGTIFGMSRALRDRRLGDKQYWWCPNGHQRCFGGKTHAQKVKDLEQAVTEMRDYATRQGDRADRNYNSLRTTKGHVTRLRNRAAEGRCQWCDEVIDDMPQHVATTHPERVNNGSEDEA